MISPQKQSDLNRQRFVYLPGPKLGICRIRHDRECSVSRAKDGHGLPYLSRFYDQGLSQPRGLPETVRFNGGKSTVALKPWWADFFAQNNTAAAQAYLKRKQSGWVNYGPWPTVEQLACASPECTYVVVYKIDNGRCYIRSYQNTGHPSDYAGVDFLQAFGVVYTDDTISDAPCGKALSLAICNPGETLWMHDYDLTWVRAV